MVVVVRLVVVVAREAASVVKVAAARRRWRWMGRWWRRRRAVGVGPSESFRKNKRKKGLHPECRFPDFFRKKQGKKVMGKVIFSEKKAKRVDLQFRGVAANGRSPDPASE